MADDWKPGDLALCVRRGRWTEDGLGPQSGAVNLVLKVDLGPCGRTYLMLEGWPDYDRYIATLFRKIHPLSIEERNAEIRILTGKLREGACVMRIKFAQGGRT